MDYGQAEEEISQRINAKLAELNLLEKFFAAPMPETEKDAKDFEAQIQKARCAIEFIDSSFQSSSGLGAITQAETLKFRLLFDARKMRGEFGAFRLIKLVKAFLIGYRLTDADPLTISAYGKVQYEAGVWFPFLDFECKTMNVQQVDASEPTLGGPFKGISSGPVSFDEAFSDGQFL